MGYLPGDTNPVGVGPDEAVALGPVQAVVLTLDLPAELDGAEGCGASFKFPGLPTIAKVARALRNDPGCVRVAVLITLQAECHQQKAIACPLGSADANAEVPG